MKSIKRHDICMFSVPDQTEVAVFDVCRVGDSRLSYNHRFREQVRENLQNIFETEAGMDRI